MPQGPIVTARRLAGGAREAAARGWRLAARGGRTTAERGWQPGSTQVWVDRAAFVVVAAAVLLIVAEFLDLFHVSAGGQALPGANRTGGQDHGYALLVIGLFAIPAAAFARTSEQWYPGAAVAALGVIALAIVLIGDLPDATSSGVTARLQAADAAPAAGLWVELVGAIALAGSGGVLIYLRRVDRSHAP